MIRGKVALGGLSVEFGNAREHFDEVASRTEELRARHEALLEEEQSILEELARIYLPELSPTSVREGLVGLRSRLRQALDIQRARRGELAHELDELARRLDPLHAALRAREDEEERAAERLEAARHEVEGALGRDTDYLARTEEHRALLERRALLVTRRARLSAVAGAERSRYEGYRPFAYLKKRRFGEAGYRAGLLARTLDRWLARRIGFDSLDRSYRILRAGPHELHAEIRRLRERAAHLEEELDRRQAEVAGTCGLTAALEADARAQDSVMEARKELEVATERRDSLSAEIRALEAHHGGVWEDLLAEHEDFLRRQPIQELIRIARSTAGPRDDALVTRLEEVRSKLERTGAELAAHQKELKRAAGRADGLAELARSAAARFSSRRSFFHDGLDLPGLVRSLVRGNTTPEEAVERLDEAHVARPVLVAQEERGFGGWFAELSSRFDRELAATLHVADEVEAEYTVFDANGKVVHRRVTRRGES